MPRKGFIPRREGQHCFENMPVHIAVEVLRLKDLGGLFQCGTLNKHRAEHCLLRLHVLGRYAIKWAEMLDHPSNLRHTGLCTPSFSWS